VTLDVLRIVASVACIAVFTLADRRLKRIRGGEVGLYDRIPGWYIAVVVVAIIGLVFAAGAPMLFGRK